MHSVTLATVAFFVWTINCNFTLGKENAADAAPVPLAGAAVTRQALVRGEARPGSRQDEQLEQGDEEERLPPALVAGFRVRRVRVRGVES